MFFEHVLQVIKLQNPSTFKDFKTDTQNYQPILLFPILSKIIERIILDQTQEFLSKNKILYRFKSGFRKTYSTNTCLEHLTNKITKGLEKGHFIGMILIDLQKVLDTIDHLILIKKTKYLGFSKKLIAWFISYLSYKNLKININASYARPFNLICGIP